MRCTVGLREDLGLPAVEQTTANLRAVRWIEPVAGPEYHRIRMLPDRGIPDPEAEDLQHLAEWLTDRLARRPDPYPGRLLPIQALTLMEAWRHRGAFAAIRVGGGKTLTSFLAFQILEARRPLYVCPAAMRPDVQREFDLYVRDWRGDAPPILSYEMLASPGAAADLEEDGSVSRLPLLERIAPDVIVLDEAHRCAASGTATARRLERHLRQHPAIVVAMTGTPFRHSIRDASHILKWALRDGAPLPRDFDERELWAAYLDAKGDTPCATGPGVLRTFCSDEERRACARSAPHRERSIIRRAVARRIFSTPGVITSQDPPLSTRLTIEGWRARTPDRAIDQAISRLYDEWCLPDGTELSDGLAMSHHVNTLGLGYWQKWDPMPPAEWVEARNEWASWVRKAIKDNRRGIDSEARMATAVRKGLYDDGGRLCRWTAARDAERRRTGLREPNSVAIWVSQEAINAAREWAQDHEGVVWVDSIPLGGALAEALQVPYYGAGGLDAGGAHIKTHVKGSAIASVRANGTGRNLQRLWWKNLWMTEPNEQALGRTHRPGQPSPVVANWVYLGCGEHLRRFWRAAEHKATWAEELTLQLQRLSQAEISVPRTETYGTEGRWRSGKE